MNSKWVVFWVCVIMALSIPVPGRAGVREDYEQAYKIYIAAGACVAAYSDRYGQLANKYLERDGWRIERIAEAGDIVDARFMLAEKRLSPGRTMYILAFVGTETGKDMKANFKVEKVHFAGSTLEEFAAAAAEQGVSSSEPKVHRGFHEFVQAGLAAVTKGADGDAGGIVEMLLKHRDRKIYIVGHSRGGAAAIIAGARLISMGVKPEQVEIITFGAPAVGNAAFAVRYEPVLNLTRVVVSGDQVTGVLQTFVSDYKQFGREVLWDMATGAENPHDMTGYADTAIKQYYDRREQARKAGFVQLMTSRTGTGAGNGAVYVAPLKNSLPEYLTRDFWYIQQALYDEYRQILPEFVFAQESASGNLLRKAAAAGCRWVVVPEVSGYRLKEERNAYCIALLQVVYDVASGEIVKAAGFSTGTFTLTPLEAFIHISKGMTYDWLMQRSSALQQH